MAESSFPVLEQPLSDQQWGQIVEGFGSGILSRRSEPYGIPNGAIDNATNTFYIGGRSPITGDGRAIVSGFFHRYTANEVISCPAVTSTTTYYFGLTYDPTRHAELGGPVSLTMTTSRPSGGGKVYLPIYRITRRSNELLSNATFTDERAFIAPQITVKGEAALPPADSVLTYTIATDWETGQAWQMQLDGRWKRIGGAQAVSPQSMTGWTTSGTDITVTRRDDGSSWAQIDGIISRSGAQFTQGTSYITHGVLLPPSVRSDRGIVYMPAMIGVYPGTVALNTSTGQVMSRLASGTTTVGNGERLSFHAGWRVS